MSNLVRLAAATVLVAAAGLTGSTPAYAAACSTASGVTVVVDFHELGGGIDQDCVADQGKADDLFGAAGHVLQNVNNQAFVCRVDGKPTQEQESCARTPPATAYWGLWWSDGKNGSWTYASQGVYSLDVPDGGSVALSWNGSAGTSPPGAPPPQHSTQEPADKPGPTKPPSTPSQPPTSGGGTSGSSGGSTGTGDAASSGAAPSGAAAAGKRDRPGPENGAGRNRQEKTDRQGATDAPSEGAASSSTDVDATPAASDPAAGSDDSALPVWVGPVAVGGLLGVAGVATYLRRRIA